MPSNKKESEIRRKNLNLSGHSVSNEKCSGRKEADDANISHMVQPPHSEDGVSAESLALRLDKYCSDLANAHKEEYCDLADFEFEDGIENLERLREMREEMHHKLTNFDFAGRTDVNFDGAAIAGAKVFMEQRAATRSITKKLTDEVGIDENNLLYSGLPYNGAETSVAKDIHERRTESIVESFVDFQKQLKFKLSVLSHAIKKIEIIGKSKSAVLPDRLPRCRKPNNAVMSSKRNVLRNAKRTPRKRQRIDPLSFNKIIDGYALEVASEVTSKTQNRRRNVAPIPFDLTILDDISLKPVCQESSERRKMIRRM